eukprot:1146844-Pelagomonas_calceolata.AAC.6
MPLCTRMILMQEKQQQIKLLYHSMPQLARAAAGQATITIPAPYPQPAKPSNQDAIRHPDPCYLDGLFGTWTPHAHKLALGVIEHHTLRVPCQDCSAQSNHREASVKASKVAAFKSPLENYWSTKVSLDAQGAQNVVNVREDCKRHMYLKCARVKIAGRSGELFQWQLSKSNLSSNKNYTWSFQKLDQALSTQHTARVSAHENCRHSAHRKSQRPCATIGAQGLHWMHRELSFMGM